MTKTYCVNAGRCFCTCEACMRRIRSINMYLHCYTHEDGCHIYCVHSKGDNEID